MEQQFDITMKHIIKSIRQAGYEPYDQLTGYLLTGDDRYITRSGNARKLIKGIGLASLTEYIRSMR